MTTLSTEEEIFLTALRFENAGWILSRSANETVKSGKQFGPLVTQAPAELTPMTVCFSFSVELYLKCLVCLETGTAPRGHSLEELMKMVSQQSQDEIEKHYEALMSDRPDRDVVDAQFGVGSTKFQNALKGANKGFEHWRYVYERNMAPGFSLSSYLAHGVRQTLINLRPNWKGFLADLSIPSTSYAATKT